MGPNPACPVLAGWPLRGGVRCAAMDFRDGFGSGVGVEYRHLDDVVPDPKAAGLEVEGELDAIGIVSGRASVKSMAALRKVRGAADVSSDHKVDIGPPDAPIS